MCNFFRWYCNVCYCSATYNDKTLQIICILLFIGSEQIVWEKTLGNFICFYVPKMIMPLSSSYQKIKLLTAKEKYNYFKLRSMIYYRLMGILTLFHKVVNKVFQSAWFFLTFPNFHLGSVRHFFFFPKKKKRIYRHWHKL